MKKNLIVVSLVLLALAVLCSCMINIDPYDPQPVKEKFTFSSIFKGPVKDKDGNITSYQFMCYVENNTGAAVENVEVEIDWKDPVGKLIFSDSVTIPRIEKDGMWPVGVIHKTDDEIEDLEGSTASIKYGKYAYDLGRYSTNLFTYGDIYHPESGDASHASGTVKNNNTYSVIDPAVYVVTEVGGKIVEYGMRKGDGILPSQGSYLFGVTLNPPAENPKTGTTYYFAVASRQSI
jgi:hypothetical protein